MTRRRWPTALGIRSDALPAYRELLHTLQHMAPTTPPCAARPNDWTDPTDDDTATTAADQCYAMQACNTYAQANDETTGVWAGQNRGARTDRPHRRRRPAA